MSMITAELRPWEKCEHTGWYHYIGNCFGDAKGRFPDGAVINTSAVVSEIHVDSDEEEYILATTARSTYKLVIRPKSKKKAKETNIDIFKDILKEANHKIRIKAEDFLP